MEKATCFARPHLLPLPDSSSRQPPQAPLATDSFFEKNW
ncbi:hypothetical protein SLEP1_g24284 [Rubroshorea leprosula]|uniref:Uncharacterized protein n=1 Tax=Rubroshorea leprosula TaxID=152421 RepID=A0AAV5JPD4_9ROSI|nr:hypothetical protein SLEP1_g24284 [Rubroshorea leprosula]